MAYSGMDHLDLPFVLLTNRPIVISGTYQLDMPFLFFPHVQRTFIFQGVLKVVMARLSSGALHSCSSSL